MFHRFSTWWRALSVVLLSLATVTWPSASFASSTPGFLLADQTPVATLSSTGNALFSAVLQLPAGTSSNAVSVSLYPRITERSEVDAISTSGPVGLHPLGTATLSANCGPATSVSFGVDLYTSSPLATRSSCKVPLLALHLDCLAAQCDGVYPVSYSVNQAGVANTKWSLITVSASNVLHPLNVSLVELLNPADIGHSRLVTSTLNTLSTFATTPFSLSANYEALSVLGSTKFQSVAKAYAKALASPQHQALNAPPATIDLGGVVSNGVSYQVGQQLQLSLTMLKAITGHYGAGPLLLSGTPSLSSLDAISAQGYNNVVLPESSLWQAPSTTLAWGSPFHLQGASSLDVLSPDTALSQLMNAGIEPGRKAALVLGTLAFLHFEEPSASHVKSVVIEGSLSHNAAAFITALLGSLKHFSYAHLSPLTPLFSSANIGANGTPSVRALRPTPTSTWSMRNVAGLNQLTNETVSFSQAVASPQLANQLEASLASTEIYGDPGARALAIAKAQSALAVQLSKFSIDPSPITLAGTGASLPITILSKSPYTVTAVVHVITDRLKFPKGNTDVITMGSPTKSLRFATSNARGSDLTLQVLVTTPNNQLVLARAAIQVRIAGTSVVGYVLSSASLIVLAFWWLRTYRRRSKGRHAR